MMKFHRGILASFMIIVCTGCASTPIKRITINNVSLEHKAYQCLQAAIQYKHNPAVRVQAVEALQHSQSDRALPWIRSALHDEHPAVRFAACVAVGVLRDSLAANAIQKNLYDHDASVRVAALFANHRLGDASATGKIPTYLLDYDEITVRRNTAMVLGMLDEPGSIKVLARAMKDRDVGVRNHALEAMARLKNPEAAQELSFMCNSGVGSEEVFAIQALAALVDRKYEGTFRYKLNTAPHIETRLAAAYALGKLGISDGYNYAQRALTQNRPILPDPNDPPEGQILRTKQLAMRALGAIGKSSSLPLLEKIMRQSNDPRIQVSAARAILEILAAHRSNDTPFAATRQKSKG